jgi:hypothetical protein
MGAKIVVLVVLHIKSISEAQGRTRTWLARHADMQYNSINRLWTEEPISDVSLVTLIKISSCLGVPVSQLYTVVSEE